MTAVTVGCINVFLWPLHFLWQMIVWQPIVSPDMWIIYKRKVLYQFSLLKVISQKNKLILMFYQHLSADMEFVTNFKRSEFWVVKFTQQIILIYVLFLFKNNVTLKTTMGFILILPKFHSIYALYHLLYSCLRQMHLNNLPKQHNKATGSESTTNNLCS